MDIPGLHVVPVGAVNAFLIAGPDGLTLIDAGFPDKADVILAAVAKLGRAPADVRHIVLTHAHPDHIGSLAALKRATGAETWMHETDAPIAERGSGFRPMTPAPGLLSKVLFAVFARGGDKKSVEPCAIDHRVTGGDLLPVAGGLRAIHAPGHCAGQIALLWESRGVLFAADACSHVMGLGPPIGYEDRAEGERSQRKLSALAFDVACFGHGKVLAPKAAEGFRAKWG